MSMRERLFGVDGPFGGYSPLRRAWRRYRPSCAARLSRSGREISAFVQRNGLYVRHGPLEGMRYPQAAVGHANILAAKLLGAYELELADVVRSVINEGFRCAINIGAGEGYYAVGLALKSPGTVVTAFETDGGERRLCARMARLNGVADRVVVHKTCDSTQLAAFNGQRTFVLCDCEGCERDLLRPDVVPMLRTATMLVELHPLLQSDITDILRARFATSHDITIIASCARDPREWRELDALSTDQAALLLSEGWLPGGPRAGPRPGSNEWAYLVPCHLHN